MGFSRPVLVTASIGTAGAVVATVGIVFAMNRPPQINPVPNPDQPSQTACQPIEPPPGHAAPPGNLSYTVSKNRERTAKTETSGLSVSETVGVSIEPPEVEKDGTDWQSATVTLHDLAVTSSWGREFPDDEGDKKGDVTLEGKVGQRVTLGVRMPAERMGGFDWQAPPSPLDPLALPVDGSMTMNGATYGSMDLSGSYRLLRGSVGLSAETGMTISVTKQEGSTVRVLVGPTETVSTALSVGLGTEDYNVSAVGGSSVSKSTLEQADYDLSTHEGREAYYSILLGGRIPDRGAISATIYGEEYAHTAGLQLKLKDLEIGNSRTWASNSRLITRNRDGSQGEELSYRENDTTMNLVGSSEPDEDEITMTKYQLRLQGAEPKDLIAFNDEYANLVGVKITKPQNLVLTFEPEDMTTFRQQALEIMAHQIRGIAARPDVERYGGQPEFDENTTAKDVENWIERTRKTGEFDKEFGLLERLTLDNGYSPVMVYIMEEDGGILHEIWRGMKEAGTSPKESLDWLRTWAEAAEQATGYDAEGPGSTICRGEVAAVPPETPEIPKDDNCGSLGGGMIAIVARGEVPCGEVRTVLNQFEENPAPASHPAEIQDWTCQVVGIPTTETTSNYSIAPMCALGGNLIRAWPADSPYPKGDHVDLADFAREDSGTGDVYRFHSSDAGFTCVLLPPLDHRPGRVYCKGALPKSVEVTDAVTKKTVPARQLWLERPDEASFHAYPDSDLVDPLGEPLPPGRVLAAYGIGCTTGKDDMVRCVNGEHQFVLRPGMAELS